MTENVDISLPHFGIRASLVIRHSCFVIVSRC
jgi:hypothetical protein